jgi:hypothetical protein
VGGKRFPSSVLPGCVDGTCGPIARERCAYSPVEARPMSYIRRSLKHAHAAPATDKVVNFEQTACSKLELIHAMNMEPTKGAGCFDFRYTTKCGRRTRADRRPAGFGSGG